MRQQETPLTPEKPLLPDAQTLEAARLGDLFAQFMTKTLHQRLLEETPEARERELTLAQMTALRYVWLHERVLIGALADGLDISFPSATNMVKRLGEKGLLQRVINPKDRREVTVALSPQGCELIERLENERIRRFDAILQQISEPERSALLNGLHQFIRLAVGSDGCTAGDICLRCGWRASTTCPLAEIIPLFACR